MEPSMMLEPVVSLIGDYKSTVFEDGPYPDRGDPKEHNLVVVLKGVSKNRR